MTNNEIYKMAERIVQRATNTGITIATAESCTGGWIGKALTDIPGSSAIFMGSLIAYSNDVKVTLLGVPQELLITHGAVSEKVAHKMAENCGQRFNVDIALSVTGIAGPGGGSREKPVGLVHMGLFNRSQTKTYEFQLENFGRDSVRRDAVIAGLTLIQQAIE